MIGHWIQQLAVFSVSDWDKYAFAREPLAGKVSVGCRVEMGENSRQCGQTFARQLRQTYGNASVKQMAASEGAEVTYLSKTGADSYILFAKYTEPKDILIYRSCAKATDDLIDQEGLRHLIGPVQTEDVLLAHELFHYLEFSCPDAYTLQKHLLLWKLGPLHNKSSIRCLGEIGAMAFACQLLELPYSPYLFDVLLLYPFSPQRAKDVYDIMMASAGKK